MPDFNYIRVSSVATSPGQGFFMPSKQKVQTTHPSSKERKVAPGGNKVFISRLGLARHRTES